jgi:ribosomal-protein-alanine N-acetyltransferase
MISHSALAFAPMQEADLDAVAAAESSLQIHPWRREQFADSLAAGVDAWIARLGGELVGYGVVMKVLDEAELLGIGILKPWQGLGLGRAFLDFLMRHARQGGARILFLEVRASNQAGRALYRAAGFSEIGLRRGYYSLPQGREDALVMRRELP